MEKIKTIILSLVLVVALAAGVNFSAQAADSYPMKNKKTVTIVDKNPTGKGKKSYFTFKVSKRSSVSLEVYQEYCDNDIKGLRTKNISVTQAQLQVKKGNKWKNIAKKQSWPHEQYDTEVLDDDDNLIQVVRIIEGSGSYDASLEPGSYRFVLTTGYPKAKVALKINPFSKPALTKYKAKKLNKKGLAEGIFTKTDTKAQWYRFSVSKKQKTQIGISYREENSKKPYLTTYLYNKSGKLLWKGSSLSGEANKRLVLKKGTYYFKVKPNTTNNNGTLYVLYSYSVD